MNTPASHADPAPVPFTAAEAERRRAERFEREQRNAIALRNADHFALCQQQQMLHSRGELSL